MSRLSTYCFAVSLLAMTSYGDAGVRKYAENKTLAGNTIRAATEIADERK